MRTIRVLVVVLVIASTLALVGGTASAQEPTLTVTPNSDLVSGQTVTVSGSDWPASLSLVMTQCVVSGAPSSCLLPAEQDTTDEAGTFTHQYVVQRIINGTDCLIAQCVLAVASFPIGPTQVVSLSFRADVAVPDVVILRRSDGALFFDNTYTTITPGSSAYFHTIVPGGTSTPNVPAGTWTFAVLVQNDSGTTAGDFTVTATSVAAPFTVQYFYGYYDVAAAMTGAGLVLPAMAPGESRPLAVRFSADPTTPTGAAADITLTVTSVTEPSLHDAVKLRVIAES